MLALTQLVGFGAGFQFSSSYLTGAPNFIGTAGGTRTHAGMSFGPEMSDRLLVACLGWGISGSTTVSALSIGGVSATIIGQCNGTNNGVCIAAARVPGGLSGDAVWSMGSSVARSSCVLYAISGQLSDAAFDTHFPAGGGVASRTATLDVPAIGAAIAIAYNGSDGDGTWTNATEDFDEGTADSSARLFGATAAGNGAVQANLGITHSNCRAIGAASWQ